jgi:hypothetical protein
VTSKEPLEDEPVPSLSIGTIVGGWSPHTTTWRSALQRLSQSVQSKREGVVSGLNVNVIFQVPGNNISPDFEGVRTGHFSRTKNWLIVQAALPETPPDDIEEDLLDRLRSAIREAEEWARRRGIADGLPELYSVVDNL